MAGFEPVSLDRQAEYRNLFGKSGIAASDYSFINLWAWAEEYGLQWCFEDSFVWIRQTRPEEVFWAPVGDFEGVSWEHAFSRLEKPNPTFIRVPQQVIDLWEKSMPGRVEVQETRGQWDYLYSVAELADLTGNRFHKKKNLVNQFRKKYEYRYADLQPRLIDQTRSMQERWCLWRDCESSETLSAENRAIERVLGTWGELHGIMGGAVIAEERVIAFCIAESFSPDTLIVHFEKGLVDYSGVYQAINQLFLDAHREFRLVNRQQDLDEEGLRKAKLSYHPVDFLRKNKVVIR